jgi:hypothetical protein
MADGGGIQSRALGVYGVGERFVAGTYGEKNEVAI